MGGEFSTNGRAEKFIRYFRPENLNGIVHPEDFGIDGKII
jgi:hypothetical protein